MSESTIEQVSQALENQGQNSQQVETPDQGAVQTTPVRNEGTVSDFAQGILKDIPDAERPIVQKYIQTWDQQVQQRFNSVHSEYEGWKPLKEQGLDPEEVQQLVALGEALNANPVETVQAIIEAYNLQSFLNPQQGAPQQPQQVPGQQITPQEQQQVVNTGQVTTEAQKQWFEQLPPEVQQRLAMVDTMAQLLLEQQQTTEQANADRELETALQSLEQKHGKFDENYVLTLASQTGDLEGAVQQYKALEQRLMAAGNAPNAAAPVVLGAGGGLPSNDIKLGEMSNKDTKELVARMLDAGKQQT